MRKGFIVAGVILLLGLAAIYILIPSKLNIAIVLPVKCNVDAADRSLRDTGDAARWWGGTNTGEMRLKITGLLRRTAIVTIDDRGISIPSQLEVFPKVRIDSCVLQWGLNLPSSVNPFLRIERYRQAKKLEADMAEVLSRLGSRLEDQRLMYGMSIVEGNTTDSMLVSTVQIFDRYPSDSAVYGLVYKLRRFIARNGGHESGSPMLNVTNQLGGMYKAEIGLPTDREMKDEGDIRWRRLIRVVFLVSEVRGGDSRIREAVTQMGNYISDYQRTVMAIPYQSLVTDRMKEADTTRWVTKLYVPVYPHNYE
jgi:hypothetical protein